MSLSSFLGYDDNVSRLANAISGNKVGTKHVRVEVWCAICGDNM